MFQEIIAIAGVPRSGTSWLGQIVESSPDVAYRYQPLFSYAFKDAVNEDSSKAEYEKFFAGIYQSSDGFLLQTDMREAHQYPRFQKLESPSRLAFKEVRYLYLLPKMLYHFANLKLLGIVRHPCGVMNSWLQNPKEFPPGSDRATEWRFGACKNQGRPENFFGYYKWKEAAHLFLDLAEKHPERVLIVKYEALVDDPPGVTASLFEFLDLRWSEQTRAFLAQSNAIHEENAYAVFKNRAVKARWRTELDPAIVQEIHDDLAGTRLQSFLEV